MAAEEAMLDAMGCTERAVYRTMNASPEEQAAMMGELTEEERDAVEGAMVATLPEKDRNDFLGTLPPKQRHPDPGPTTIR